MILTNAPSSALQLRLLIVDDDIGLLDAMKRSLRESVQMVVACDSFERSLALWKELEAKAAVDAENRSQRADMETGLARCRAADR